MFAKFHETDDQDEDEDEEYEDEDDEEEEEGEKGQEAEETEVVDGEEENRCKRFANLLFGRPCSPPPGPHLGAQWVRSGISGLPRASLGRAPNPKGPPGEALCAARSRSRGPRSDFGNVKKPLVFIVF